MLGPLHPLVPQTRASPAPDGTRRFEALGGYPTRSQAEAALADALARRSHGIALDPAKLTVDQYLDRWLAHIRTSLGNVASQAVLARNGFERYGLAPRYLRIAGRWQDHVLFQVLNARLEEPGSVSS